MNKIRVYLPCLIVSFSVSSLVRTSLMLQKFKVNFSFEVKNFFNVNTFLKSVSTAKSRVTYDLDTDTDTTTRKIIGVVGSPLYLATPVSTALPKSHLSL